MTQEEELDQLRAEKLALCEALRRKDEELEQARKANQDLREGLKQAIMAIEYLHERVRVLEGQQAKDSHNSNLPPSSDRFVRPPKLDFVHCFISNRQPWQNDRGSNGGLKPHQDQWVLWKKRSSP